MKVFLQAQQVDFQLAPPYSHRRNHAERGIRTFQDHFTAGMASVDPRFPRRLWHKLLNQATITLNLLRPARLNPQLSAYAFLFRAFDFNRTPLAPPGTKVLVHEKPNKRPTWNDHGVEGWYIGPLMNHYRCYTCYIIQNDGIRDSDVVEFSPYHLPIPALNTQDNTLRAAMELTDTLKQPNCFQPFLPTGPPHIQAVKEIAAILKDTMEARHQRLQPQQAPLQGVPNQGPYALLPPLPPTIPQPPGPMAQAPRIPTGPPATDNYLGRTKVEALPATNKWIWVPTSLRQGVANAATTMIEGLPKPKSMEYRNLIKDPTQKATRDKSCTNEFARLAQGYGDTKGTNTILFCPRTANKQDKTAVYVSYRCDIRPPKTETHCTRLVVGGNLLNPISTTEAEFGALFVNGQEADPIRTTLQELGHPQPATPIQTDNATAMGIANDTVKQRKSKAMDMRFYWIQDRIKQGHYMVYWAPGYLNLADYVTKHHLGPHHEKMRPYYLCTPSSPLLIPGFNLQ